MVEVTPMGTEAVLVLEASVTVATATTPPAIWLEFIPLARHIAVPLPLWQEIVFPAAVRADPAETLIEATSPAAYEKVHCKADADVDALRLKFNGTEPPGAAEPEARLRDWPKAEPLKRMTNKKGKILPLVCLVTFDGTVSLNTFPPSPMLKGTLF
jgi:hypothetical protein